VDLVPQFFFQIPAFIRNCNDHIQSVVDLKTNVVSHLG
jgi:hypothetical protein